MRKEVENKKNSALAFDIRIFQTTLQNFSFLSTGRHTCNQVEMFPRPLTITKIPTRSEERH